jgi:hypothetical protein
MYPHRNLLDLPHALRDKESSIPARLPRPRRSIPLLQSSPAARAHASHAQIPSAGQIVFALGKGASVETAQATLTDFMTFYNVTLLNQAFLAGLLIGSMLVLYRAYVGFSPHCTPCARRAGVAPSRRRDRYASSARLVPTHAERTLLSEKPTCAR